MEIGALIINSVGCAMHYTMTSGDGTECLILDRQVCRFTDCEEVDRQN